MRRRITSRNCLLKEKDAYNGKVINSGAELNYTKNWMGEYYEDVGGGTLIKMN